MEAKTEYKISAPAPGDIQVTADTPTLAELKEYRAAWLAKAVADLKTVDLIRVAGILCGRSYYDKRYTHKWARGEITMIYHVTSNHSPQSVVHVEDVKSGKTVAVIHTVRPELDADFWIPGLWVGQIKHLMGLADKKEIEIGKIKRKRERIELIELLGLGGSA